MDLVLSTAHLEFNISLSLNEVIRNSPEKLSRLLNTNAWPNGYSSTLPVMLLCCRYFQVIEYGQIGSEIANYNANQGADL